MRSLFSRILLWSAATIAITFIGFFVITAMTIDSSSRRLRWSRFLLQEARHTYETGGEAALAAFLTRRKAGIGADYILTDSEGQDLLTGDDLSHLKSTGPNSWRFFFRTGGPWTLVSTDGEYRFIVRVPQQDSAFWFFHPQHLWVLVVSILLSSALAFYLTSPLRELEKTVERFGQGDLSALTRSKRGDELGKLARSFDRMAERTQILLTAERRLLQDVSHELRSPLARLNVAAALTQSEADRPAALEQIRKECERLNALIGELLQLTRAEGEGGNLQKVSVDLHSLLAEVADDCSIEAQARDCKLNLRAPSGIAVLGDPELLRRAVENLVRNAIRYAAEGTSVEVMLERRDETALISVRDHGPGVPAEDLDRIFDPFYRVNGDRDRSSGGVGLGLSIARRAVELHQGDLRARNSSPGLTVEMRLPGLLPDSATAS